MQSQKNLPHEKVVFDCIVDFILGGSNPPFIWEFSWVVN